jgi:hypothetical protein
MPAQAVADNAELAKRNTRLIEESEALLMRCQTTRDIQKQLSSPAVKKNKKGLFPFRRSVEKERMQTSLAPSLCRSGTVGLMWPCLYQDEQSSMLGEPCHGGMMGMERHCCVFHYLL